MNRIVFFSLLFPLTVAGCSRASDERCAGGLELGSSACESPGEPVVISVTDDVDFKANEAATQRASVEVWRGDAVAPGELPAVVALSSRVSGGEFVCSANLIAPQLILTAAHCCGEDETCSNIAAVRFGERFDTAHTIAIEKGYIRKAPRIDGYNIDAIILRLEKPAVDVEPFFLAPSDWIDGAKEMRIAGFGWTEKSVIGVKMKADIPIASHSCLRKDGVLDRYRYGCVEGLEMVGAIAGERDSCDGDSGGAAIVAPPESAVPFTAFNASLGAGEYALAAIIRQQISPSVEWVREICGENGCRECGDGGIYLRLDGRISDWIVSVAEETGEQVRIAQ